MTEKQVYQEIDATQATVTEVELSRQEVMDKFAINSVNTLKRWCRVAGVEYGAVFFPDAIAKLSHLHHHVSLGGMTMKDYEAMIGQSQPDVTPDESHGRYTATDDDENGSAISQVARSRYQGAVSALAKPLAKQFWSDLDKAVLAEVAQLAQSRKSEVTAIEAVVLAEFEANPLLLLPSNGDGVGC